MRRGGLRREVISAEGRSVARAREWKAVHLHAHLLPPCVAPVWRGDSVMGVVVTGPACLSARAYRGTVRVNMEDGVLTKSSWTS